MFPYSDKGEEGNSDKSGTFGTGFLATHILTKNKVKGIYIKDEQTFNFILDRSGLDKPEIAKSIDNTWQEFKATWTEIENHVYWSTNFETSFKYELDTDSLELATQSISDFDVSLPFALAFIPKIASVEILNQISNSTITYHKIEERTEHLTENIKHQTYCNKEKDFWKWAEQNLNYQFNNGLIQSSLELNWSFSILWYVDTIFTKSVIII